MSSKAQALFKAEKGTEENWLFSLWHHIYFVKEMKNSSSIPKKIKNKKD